MIDVTEEREAIALVARMAAEAILPPALVRSFRRLPLREQVFGLYFVARLADEARAAASWERRLRLLDAMEGLEARA